MLPVQPVALSDDAELFGAVSHSLWLQRELLFTLLYHLVAEQLVLSSGSTRFLARADDDVRHAVDDVRAAEVARAVHVEQLSTTLGMTGEVSLTELAEAAPPLWADILRDHRSALRDLALEIQGVADENHRLLESGAKTVRETLSSVGRIVTRYDARGAAVHAVPYSLLLDEQA